MGGRLLTGADPMNKNAFLAKARGRKGEHFQNTMTQIWYAVYRVFAGMIRLWIALLIQAMKIKYFPRCIAG